MADNIYTVTPVSVEGISQYERYSAQDTNLIDSFEINTAFDSKKNISELHIYTVGNTLLRSITNYDRYKIELGSGASAEGSTSLTLDPEKDAIYYGYESGGVKLLYLFLNNLFSDLKQGLKLYVKEISNDRTELKLSSTGISNEDLKKYASELKGRIEDTSFFSEFRLNFGNNDLFIGVNIDYNDDEDVVTIKLYEPLPNVFTIKSTLDIVEFISNPLAYEIEAEFTPDAPRVPRLREANFNLELDDNTATPSQYFSFDELFSYNIENTNYQVLSLFNEKGAEISIDHTDYSDFIHFSSAEERLINFKYKLDLIKNYESSISNISNDLGTSGVTNNKEYYQKLLKGVVDNFDHYERYLYFESGSYAWPKSNENKPYINQASTTSESITWFANQRTAANNYDVSNFNALTNTIPAFIREDDNNTQYVLFVQMLAQHFDNLYVYAKAVSDKYDADNRINVGVSRDLVEDAIKSLGVKLYNSSKSLEDLFKYFVGEFQRDFGEVVNTDVQAGQLISGGTAVEGPNEGFDVTLSNAEQVLFMPLLYSLFKPLRLYFGNDLTNVQFSSGFDFFYFQNNNGGDVYITFIYESTNYGPFRYTIHNTVSNAILFNQPGTINPSNSTVYHINPVDADGEDHTDLFTSFHGVVDPFDVIIEDKKVTGGTPITKAYQPTSEDIYQKSIYKRIYHNLPFLLKTKGTQRGLRALINCFGIPANVLKIKTYGGRDTSERPFLGDGQSHTVSNQKIRTDNTGSIVEGDTLSAYTSIVKTDDSYNQDLHNVEVGFSPSDSLDSLIQSTLGDSFSIDDYIGDPRDLTLDNYSDLLQATKTALADVTERYDIKDFVRLIKFFDNVVFKMIKDFVPARSTTDTGIIIKPHLLDRSKAKSISASATQPEYSGSIDTAFITGSNPGTYKSSASGSLRFDSQSSKIRANILLGTPGESSTRRILKYSKIIKNPETDFTSRSYLTYTDHGQDEAKFDGELANSNVQVSTGELNDENALKEIRYPSIEYDVFLFRQPPEDICLVTDSSEIITIGNFDGTEDKVIHVQNDLFDGAPTLRFYGPNGKAGVTNLTFTDGQPNNLETATEIESGKITIKGGDNDTFEQYEEFTVTGYNASVDGEGLTLAPSCASTRTFKVVRCALKKTNEAPAQIYANGTYDITQWFKGDNINEFRKYTVDGTFIEEPENYIAKAGDSVFKVEDNYDENCFAIHTVSSDTCGGRAQRKAVITTNDLTGRQRYNVPSFFSGINTEIERVTYLIRLFDDNGEEFDAQAIDYYLLPEYTLYGNEGTWIKLSQSTDLSISKAENLPTVIGTLLRELFGRENNFQGREDNENLARVEQVEFRAVTGNGCDYRVENKATLISIALTDPALSIRKIDLIYGTNCEICRFNSNSEEYLEAYYKATDTLSLDDIYGESIRLYKTKADAEIELFDGQIGELFPLNSSINIADANSPSLDSYIVYTYVPSKTDYGGGPWQNFQRLNCFSSTIRNQCLQ